MEQTIAKVADVNSLIIAIAGMFSTLVVAALGLYFTARARSAPMREMLYSKQLDLARQIFKAFGRGRMYAALLTPDNEYRDRARVDIGGVIKRLSVLTDEAAALFPTELYIAVGDASKEFTSLLVEFDEGRDTKVISGRVAARTAKAALIVRALLGIDELSVESIRLFSKKDALERLAEFTPPEINAEPEQKPTVEQKESPKDR
jgi:hypothetical protein